MSPIRWSPATRSTASVRATACACVPNGITRRSTAARRVRRTASGATARWATFPSIVIICASASDCAISAAKYGLPSARRCTSPTRSTSAGAQVGCDNSADVGVGERAQFDVDYLDALRQAVHELLSRRVRLGDVRAKGEDQTDRGGREAVEHHREQSQRVVVQLVQVVDRQRERTRRGECRQQPAHGCARPPERGAGRLGCGERQVQRRRRIPAEPFAEGCRRSPHGRRPSGVRHLALQPIRADSQHSPGPLRQPVGGLGQQPGLADPRLS